MIKMASPSTVMLFGILLLRLSLQKDVEQHDSEVYPLTSPKQSTCIGIHCIVSTVTHEYESYDTNTSTILVAVIQPATCQKEEWRPFLVDSVIINIVLKRLGTVKCVSKTPNEMMIENNTGKFDIIGEALVPLVYTNKFVDRINTYHQDDLGVVLKKINPERQSILQAFNLYTWVETLFCLVLFGVTLRLAGRREVVLETLRTTISGGFTEDPNNPIANYLSLLLSVFGLIMVTAFCARFMSFLAINKEAKQPQTLEDVDERVTRIYGMLNESRDDFPDKTLKSLMGKIINDYDNEEMKEDISSSSEAALILTDEDFSIHCLLIAWVDNRTKTSQMYHVPQRILSPSFDVISVRKGWPLRANMSKMLLYVIETGLRFKAKDDMKALLWKSGIITTALSRSPYEEPKALGMGATKDPMAVLGLGTALATIAFLGEMTVDRWRRLQI